jgi:hypothetical protein
MWMATATKLLTAADSITWVDMICRRMLMRIKFSLRNFDENSKMIFFEKAKISNFQKEKTMQPYDKTIVDLKSDPNDN